MPKPVTLDQLRSQKKAVRRSVRLATDDEVAEVHRDAKRRLEFAKGHSERNPTNPDAQDAFSLMKKAFADAEKDMAKHSVKFTFQAIGYRKYDALMQKHMCSDERRAELVKKLPTTEEGAEAAKQITWDPDTFPIALIVASMIEPEGDNGDLKEWLEDDTWNMAELNALFAAALDCNQAHGVVSLGNA